MMDGKLDMLEKVRTRKVAMDRLVELIVESVGNKEIDKLAIVHINNLTDSNELLERLKEKLRVPKDIYIMDFNGANWLRLTTDPGYDFSPAWRPLPSN